MAALAFFCFCAALAVPARLLPSPSGRVGSALLPPHCAPVSLPHAAPLSAAFVPRGLGEVQPGGSPHRCVPAWVVCLFPPFAAAPCALRFLSVLGRCLPHAAPSGRSRVALGSLRNRNPTHTPDHDAAGARSDSGGSNRGGAILLASTFLCTGMHRRDHDRTARWELESCSSCRSRNCTDQQHPSFHRFLELASAIPDECRSALQR